jgi:hypothetical protein
MRSRSQSSAYWRIGLEPMKVAASMRRPDFCEISMMGLISALRVRAAHGLI